MEYQGLKESEVAPLKLKYGSNLIKEDQGISPFMIFIDQFSSPLVRIAVIVSLFSFFLKDYTDAILIQIVALINAVTGYLQEHSAQKTFSSLQKLLKPKAMVIRDGKRQQILAIDIVPGDLCVLEPGDRIPGDGTIIKNDGLLVNEAILTGEEESVEKTATNEKTNHVFMGTIVFSGRGIIKIEKIGKETEIGKIGASLDQIEDEKTPTQIKIELLVKEIGIMIFIACLIVFILGLVKQNNFFESVKYSIILAIAAIPQGLPIAVTIIMALGMNRIFKKNGLVKKLISLETLGSTSVICIDKTGTITEGKMQVVKSDFDNKEMALIGSVLNNDRKRNLEIALWNFAKDEGLDPETLYQNSPRVYEELFDSEKKYSLTVKKVKGKEIGFLMGAPEIVLALCHLPEKENAIILKKILNWAEDGLRVAGIAYKAKGDFKNKKGYLWAGLYGVEDPLRKDAKETIAEAQRAGIKIKIVTGDYRQTAEKIAKNLGFSITKLNVMEGEELEAISDEDLKKRVLDIVLFARVTPHQKLKIVRVLQELGETVAMTGDGVNDAPALKKANIGVVVGNATDVAKDAGDIILLDSNLKTIVASCYEGRLIFTNIKKVVGYVLSNSFAEIFLILGAMLLNLPAPLTVAQLLWHHMICDGPPDIVLGFEPMDKSITKEKPAYFRKGELLPIKMKFLVVILSAITGLTALYFFNQYISDNQSLIVSRTIAFATIASVSLVYIFSFKNLDSLIIKTDTFFQNKYIFLGLIYGFLLVFAAIYLPTLNRILGTTPLTFTQWIPVIIAIALTTIAAEVMKLVPGKRS
jgi:P-type Ca2+ transporter type 2C